MTNEEFCEEIEVPGEVSFDALEAAWLRKIEEYERQREKIPVKTTKIILQRKIDALREVFPEVKKRYKIREAIALLGQVTGLIGENQLSKAQVKVNLADKLVSEFSDEDDEVAANLQEMQASIDDARAPQEGEQIKQFAERMKDFHESLREGRIDEAESRLNEATNIAMLITRSDIKQQQKQAVEALAAKRADIELRDRLDSEIADYNSALEEENFDRAGEILNSIESNESKYKGLLPPSDLKKWKRDLAKAIAAKEMKQRLKELFTTIESNLTAGEWKNAETNIADTRALCDEIDAPEGHERLNQLSNKLQKQRFKELISKAEAAIAEKRFSVAEGIIEEAGAVISGGEKIEAESQRLEELRAEIKRRLEEAELRQRAALLEESFKRALQEDRLDEAEKQVEDLERLLASIEEPSRLGINIKIEDCRRELEEARNLYACKSRFQELLEELDAIIEGAGAAEDFSAAHELLLEADEIGLRIATNDAKLKLAEIRERLDKAEERAKTRQSIQNLMADFRLLLSRKKMAAAGKQLAKIKKLEKSIDDPKLKQQIQKASNDLKEAEGPGLFGRMAQKAASALSKGETGAGAASEFEGYLKVIEGDRVGEIFGIAKTSIITLGRKALTKSDDPNLVLFDDPSKRLQPRQAIIRWQPDENTATLENKSLSNPTLVNHKPVPANRPVTLQEGDTIMLPASRKITLQFLKNLS